MNIRRGLIRIWVVLTALLLIPVGIIVYEGWQKAQGVYEVEIEGRRFELSAAAIDRPESERDQIIDRVAWLNGIRRTFAGADVGAKPLSPK